LNLYFLVEGEKTEPIVYSQWLKYLLPNFNQVNFACDADTNNYYLVSGLGMPRLLDIELPKVILEINELGNYDYLVLIVDADDATTEEITTEIKQFIDDKNIVLNSPCKWLIIAQKYCIETWFLGNRKVYPRNTDNIDFINHAKHYDVSLQDPELMEKPNTFAGSTSIYHEHYLRKMLACRNIRYSKSDPREVGEKYYLEELTKRINETPHLSSLKSFFSFCESISI
jgi:hypothetical protein